MNRRVAERCVTAVPALARGRARNVMMTLALATPLAFAGCATYPYDPYGAGYGYGYDSPGAVGGYYGPNTIYEPGPAFFGGYYGGGPGWRDRDHDRDRDRGGHHPDHDGWNGGRDRAPPGSAQGAGPGRPGGPPPAAGGMPQPAPQTGGGNRGGGGGGGWARGGDAHGGGGGHDGDHGAGSGSPPSGTAHWH